MNEVVPSESIVIQPGDLEKKVEVSAIDHERIMDGQEIDVDVTVIEILYQKLYVQFEQKKIEYLFLVGKSGKSFIFKIDLDDRRKELNRIVEELDFLAEKLIEFGRKTLASPAVGEDIESAGVGPVAFGV